MQIALLKILAISVPCAGIVLWNVAWYYGVRAKLLKALAVIFAGIVLWNVVWYYGMRASVKSNFRSMHTPVFQGDELDRTYRFTRVDCESVGYDCTHFLDAAIKACYLYERDVEISIKLSGNFLTVLARAEGMRDETALFGKDYQLGKDAMCGGKDIVLFQSIETSGGYGTGLGLFNTVSKASFGEQKLEYSVCETRYWLAFFLIPVVQKDHWSISLPIATIRTF